jgi:hypothetical protein
LQIETGELRCGYSQSKLILVTFDARPVGCVGCGDLAGVVLAEDVGEVTLAQHHRRSHL